MTRHAYTTVETFTRSASNRRFAVPAFARSDTSTNGSSINYVSYAVIRHRRFGQRLF